MAGQCCLPTRSGAFLWRHSIVHMHSQIFRHTRRCSEGHRRSHRAAKAAKTRKPPDNLLHLIATVASSNSQERVYRAMPHALAARSPSRRIRWVLRNVDVRVCTCVRAATFGRIERGLFGRCLGLGWRFCPHVRQHVAFEDGERVAAVCMRTHETFRAGKLGSWVARMSRNAPLSALPGSNHSARQVTAETKRNPTVTSAER